MAAELPRVFYRIVKSDSPTPRDFLSQKALGVQVRHPTRRALRIWDGISVYRTREQAVALAAVSPHLGRYVAELRVPEAGPVRYELDTARHGHCTLWGEPVDLLALVVSVVPA